MVSTSNSKKIYCSKYPSSGAYILSISFSEISTSIENNTSTIRLSGSIESTGVSWDSSYDYYLKLYWFDNYTQKEILVATSDAFCDLKANAKESVSGNITVTHKEDGSLNGYATLKYISGSTSGGYAPSSNSVSTSNTALTKIARVSSIDSIEGKYLGEVVNVNITRKVSSYVHKVEWKIGNSEYVVVSNDITSSCSFTPDLSYASYYPNSNIALLTVRLTTYNGTSQIGNSVTNSISLTIPDVDELKPTFDFVENRIDNQVPSDWNVYVQGYSQCKLEILNEQGSYGANIASYSISGAGITSASQTLTTGILNQLSYLFKATIIDSRGISRTKEIEIQVENYQLPTINLNAKRCLNDGTISSLGTYLYVISSYSYASVSNKNVISKEIVCNNVSNTKFENEEAFILDAACLINNTYTVTATIKDALNNQSTVTVKIPTSSRIINVKKNKKGIAFGGFSEEDNVLKSFWPMKVEGDIYSNDKKVSLEGHVHDYASSSHTHSYAGSSSAGGAANSVKSSLTISLNGTSQGSYNGSSAKNIDISADSIGAALSSHTHDYSPVGASVSNGSCVSLWSGSDTAFSFTVSNIAQYKYFLVQCGTSDSSYLTWIFVPYCNSYVNTSFRGIGGYETTSSTNGGEIQFIRGTISNNTITIASAWLRKTATITSNSSTIQLYIKRIVGVK